MRLDIAKQCCLQGRQHTVLVSNVVSVTAGCCRVDVKTSVVPGCVRVIYDVIPGSVIVSSSVVVCGAAVLVS